MTSKFKIGIVVTLAVVIIVVLLVSRSVVRTRPAIQEPPLARAVAHRQTSAHPDGWTKIDVDKKFSFYVPPDVKEEADLGHIDYLGPTKWFGTEQLRAGYTYVEKLSNEQAWRGRVSCDLLTKDLEANPGFQGSEVEISNRIARQVSCQFEKREVLSRLCFRDVGDETILMFTATYEPERAEDARKIFSSIEFP
jgi:hypothetical protein